MRRLEEPFAARGGRPIRVVVDPRLLESDRDPFLRALLQAETFELGTVGRSDEDLIRIHVFILPLLQSGFGVVERGEWSW